MATLYKAESISNLELADPVLSPLGKFGGRVRCAMPTFTVDGDGSASFIGTDIFHFIKLPSHATVVSLRMINDDLGSTIDTNIGLYLPIAGDSGDELNATVVDMDCFCEDVNLGQQAETIKWELLGGPAASDMIGNIGEPLWVWAGETSDPQVDYWISMTFGTTTSSIPTDARSFGLIILYVID